MRFTVPAARFSELTRRAMQFRHRGRDILPGYSLGSFVVKNGQLRITVVSPNQATSLRCDAKGEDGELLMKLDLVDKMISFLPASGDLTISVTGAQAKFAVGGVRMHTPVITNDQAIDMPKPPKDGWKTMSASTLLDIVTRLWSQDTGDRPHFAGIHFTGERAEATNTHAISRLTPGVDFGRPVMVQNMRVLQSFLYDGGDVSYALSGNWVWFRTKTWATCLLRYESDWPPTDAFLYPADVDEHNGTPIHKIFINRQEMLKACQRIAGMAVGEEEKKVGAGVSFDLRDDGLHMVSNYPIENLAQTIVVDELIEWAEDTVKQEDLKPFESLRQMAIYGQYLRKTLEAMRGKIVRMCWGGDITKAFPQWQDTESQLRVAIAPRRIGPTS